MSKGIMKFGIGVLALFSILVLSSTTFAQAQPAPPSCATESQITSDMEIQKVFALYSVDTERGDRLSMLMPALPPTPYTHVVMYGLPGKVLVVYFNNGCYIGHAVLDNDDMYDALKYLETGVGA